MWRLTKAIIVSWLVGVMCGVGMVIILQRDGRAPPATNVSIQAPPQTSGVAPPSPNASARESNPSSVP
jgi:hypothetical protein